MAHFFSDRIKPIIYIVDTIGEHRGMHYFNLPLVAELNKLGIRTVYISTRETEMSPLRTNDVPVRGVFRGIYGDQPKWQRGLRYMFGLTRIAWWCLRERPSIVHFHFQQIPVLDYLLLWFLERINIRTVITVHDVLPFEMGKELNQAASGVFHRLYTHASGLILISKHAYKEIERFDSDLTTKAVLIPQGGYTEIYSKLAKHTLTGMDARARLGIDPGENTILVFGTIKKNKRLDLILRAVREVSTKHPNVRLLIIGKPQDYDVTGDIKLAENLGIESKVTWRLERINDEDMGLYFSAADLVFFPYEWIYQSAVVIMAMSFSKPVIATAVEGNKEWVTDKITGLLVPLDNIQEWTRAIEFIFENSQLAAKMGRAASEYVARELSWDKIARETLEFYQKVYKHKMS